MSYEEARSVISGLVNSQDPDIREVRWLSSAKVVGVARDNEGRIEVFLAGPKLHPRSRTLRDSVDFGLVHYDATTSFAANRLLLPALGHFDQVAAFICIELLRTGADVSLARAFARTEPIVELAIERLHMSHQAAIGLAGELLVIEALCCQAEDRYIGEIISGWEGWKRSSRDLTVGGTGIEVKTTTGPTSSHFVEGLHQVERNDGSDGTESEHRLVLISVGVQVAGTEGNVFTIRQLVDQVVSHMTRAGVPEMAVEKFLAHVAEYGGGSGSGCEPDAHATDPAFSARFQTSFLRAYDMDDPALQVLRRRDVAPLAHVEDRSVRFRVELPVTLSAGNPVTGANQSARDILRREGWATA